VKLSDFVFDRTEFQNELNMMHSGDEDDELCSVQSEIGFHYDSFTVNGLEINYFKN